MRTVPVMSAGPWPATSKSSALERESIIPSTIATRTPLSSSRSWLLPRQRGGTPRWDSRKFPKADRAGRLIELASGDPKNVETLLIRADARVMGATLLAGTSLTHAPARYRHSYLAPAQGVILVNGQQVAVGDGIA